MFKDNPDSMHRSGIERTVKKCADLINAESRLFFPEDGKVRSKTFGSMEVR
jgi:hypothetical protein